MASASSAPVPPDPSASAAPTSSAPTYASRAIPLPGASGALTLDYIAIDRAGGRVWVPAANTASVDVLDVASGKLTRIEGFKTAEMTGRGGVKRVVGPSSATVGDGVAYVGNRGTKEVCAIDVAKLARGACVTLPTAPDGIQYVASSKEVWVTTPRDKSLTVLDASKHDKLVVKARIALEGDPEGYAIDEARGVFFTNLEDKDKTVSVDVKSRKVTATWDAKCGSDGPRGLALDSARGFLFVACTTGVEALDAKTGAILAKLDTGAGVDNIDYLDAKKQLFVAAGKAATLTVATVDDKGALTVLATSPTAQGARNVVADSRGVAYVADGNNGQLLVLTPP
jgi:DNA-binding beta-propeller fold protein YncE